MLFLTTLITFLLSQAVPATAQSPQLRYELRFDARSGAKFTELSGHMVVPELPRAGAYSLWPGLQPTDNSGAYRAALDGSSGKWYFGSGWHASDNTSVSGGGFNANRGEVVSFKSVQDAAAREWNTTLVSESTEDTVMNQFPLTDKSFNLAIFAIELQDVAWDFGSFKFTNVTMVSEGSADGSWCNGFPENLNSAAVYNITGVSAAVSGTTVTCTIDSLVLLGPEVQG